MSWKATAFVKEIVDNITPTEKLLLFVLADYHNTARHVAWPTLETLATESLMSKRNAIRMMANLEAKGVIKREHVQGDSRNTTFYSFPALDSRCQIVTCEPSPGDTPGDNSGDTQGSVIRKNGVELDNRLIPSTSSQGEGF